MRDKVVLPSRLSWSSLSTYVDCGERWRLERGHKIESGTWFATVAGSVIHEISELVDAAFEAGFDEAELLEFAGMFTPRFDAALAEEYASGVEVKASGRVTKELTESGGPNKKDYVWWTVYGPVFVQRWVRWRCSTNWVLATIDGKPAVEVAFEAVMPGTDVPVVGYIDRVFIEPTTGGLIVFDLKTGKEPSGSLQLGTYKVGLEQSFGVTPLYGVFWLPSAPKKDEPDVGRLSRVVLLDDWDSDRIGNMYGQAMTGISAGVFLPHVSSMCSGCGVRDFCWAVAGEKRVQVPAVSEFGDSDS